MERLNFRVKRTNPDMYSSLPCSGGTNYWPINYSIDCSGMSMYNATASQLMNALNGDITTFPEDLRQCSLTNPCVILWDLNYSVSTGHCTNIGNYAYKAFYGFNVHDSAPTQVVTGETYDYVITLFESLYVDFSKPINTTSDYTLSYIIGPCHCDPGLEENLNNLTLLLSQDFNDIGHYSIWDGNIFQKETFSNFVFTASTFVVVPGDTIQIWNTTDFSYYKEVQELPYTIDWGDGNSTTLNFSVGGAITAENTYPPGPPMEYRITITQDSPWGPTSVSQVITAPNYSYPQLVATNQIPANSALTINPSGVTVGTGYTSGPSGVFGQSNYIPWDTGTHIDEYSGMTQFPNCFEVTGVTTSMLGIFQTYTTSNSPNLPPGYVIGTIVPIGGDIINPITNNIETGMYGQINWADPIYTGYTISSANNATPIHFYDFPNGITLYVAESCGLDALAFGAYDCFKCTVEDCEYCETKDEYIDRITGIWTPITFNTQRGVWSPYTDYMVGDIVFDTTYNTCCCFMAVADIFQTGLTQSLWSGRPPSETLQGVWYQNSLPIAHIWEACSPECVNCPPGTTLPCDDTTFPHVNSPVAPSPNVGKAGLFQNGYSYSVGDFVFGQEGNCYQALSATSGNYPPTAFTSTTYWEYVGCSTWICPQDLNNIPVLSCELVPGTGITTSTNVIQGHQYYGGCLDDFDDGECYADRWLCPGQYGCTGCTQIDSTHSLYTSYDPMNPLAGPVFANSIDCEGWCNPPAYSCTTQQSANPNACCTLFSCAEDDANMTPGVYTSLVTTVVALVPPVPPNGLNMNEWLAINESFYFTGPPTNFNLPNVCNSGTNGVTPTSYAWSTSACCNYEGFDYECCTGCVPVTFGGAYNDLAACQTDPNNNGGATQPCGWTCETINQPCIPCYDCFCGYAGYGFTQAGYSACTADCQVIESAWICDCTNSMTPCTYVTPAPGPVDNVVIFSGNVAGSILCNQLCPCDAGWDCFIDVTTGQPTYCQDGVSGYYMAQNDLGFSNPNPNFTGYSDFTACCEATDCCFADCDITAAPGTEPGNQVAFPGGNWPCYYIPQFQPPQPGLNCDPTGPPNWGLPYCNMLECTSALALNPLPPPAPAYICDVPTVDDCYCACDDYMTNIGQGGTVLTSQGQYVIMGNYTLHDIVYHWDADSPLCCYVCMCPSLMGSADCITTFDCSCFIPDDGPSTGGVPNCWEPCGATPGTAPTGCDPCGIVQSNTWECTTSGCSMSSCIHNPGLTQESQNCYTGNTCEGHCRASCYCENATTDTTNCVVLQDWMNNTNTGIFFGGYPTWPPVPPGATHPVYPMASLDNCLAMLSVMDCCPGGSADTWYCDWTSNCETVAGNAGLGCVIIPAGTPGYPGPFTSLDDCEDWCTWECGCPPNGLGTCVFNALSTAAVTAGSAYDCWLMNGGDCDCCAPPDEWWCDTYGAANGDYTTAVPASACRPGSYYGGASVLHQQGAIGQLVGGPADPTNTYFDAQVTNNFTGIGFPDQLSCEQYCRFCCDCPSPPGTAHCNDVDWGIATCTCTQIPSELTPFFCEQQTTLTPLGFPCVPSATTEWWCIDIVGCQPYLSSSPPSSFISGPHIDLITCQSVCSWACGDCINDCFCTFQASQYCVPNYTTEALCQTAVASVIVYAGANSCCECYECFSTGSISYTYFDDTLNSWQIGSVTVSPFTGPAPMWNMGTNYSIGDVVMFIFDGTPCCYVAVDDDPGNFWTIDPYTYYTYYQNDLNNTTPVWPGPAGPGTNANNSGTLVWITCNPNCVTVPSITYDCIPGVTTPSPGDCSNMTLIPGGLIGAFSAIFWLCDPVNGVPPATPFSDYYYENLSWTGLGSPCLDSNGHALAYPITMTFPVCINDSVFEAAYMPMVSHSKQEWVDHLVNAGLAANVGMDWWALRALLAAVCGQSNMIVSSDHCECPTTSCTCVPVTGPGGQYPDSPSCNQALLSDPCCGYWECIPGAMCSCVFNNTLTTYLGPPFNYLTQTACESDLTTCCSGTTSMNYLCRDFDCQCVQDPLGTFPSLIDCLNDQSECCWTGTTTTYDCIQGNNQQCHCVTVTSPAVGQYPTIGDCLSDQTECCYTGMSGTVMYDCDQTLGACNCVAVMPPGTWGPFPTMHDCQTSHTCCYTGNTGTTGFLCRQSIVTHGGPGGVITHSLQCICEPTNTSPVYATLGDCLNDPTDCCWTGTTAGLCIDCQDTYMLEFQPLDGTYSPYGQYMSSAIGTFDNTATGQGNASPEVWGLNLLWGSNQIVLSPIDQCCYIFVGDSDPTHAYYAFDPAVCYQNWLLGLACDGSSSANPTQVWTHQQPSQIWVPCDPHCSAHNMPTYDCNQFFQCVSPIGGGGFYTGPTAYNDCLLGCNPPGCDDCSSVLNSFMVPGAPVSFLGTWQPTVVYTDNECVVDPDDLCCYCCVVIDDSIWSPGDALSCKDFHQPSAYINVAMAGGGGWMSCGYTQIGDPCYGTGDCDGCYTTLASALGTTPITFTPWPGNSGSFNYLFGGCVTDPVDGCCYCCVDDNAIAPPPANARMATPMSSSFPCAIINGTFTPGFNGHWESCLVDQSGNMCTPAIVYGCTDCGTIWENDPILNPGGLMCWEITQGSVLNPLNFPNPTVIAGATNFYVGANADNGGCTY